MGINTLNSEDEFKLTINNSKQNQLLVFHFSATWAPQCAQMNSIIDELSKDDTLSNVSYYQLEAENVPDLSVKYNVQAVPTFILIKNKRLADRVDGANGPELQKKIKQKSEEIVPNPEIPTLPKENLETRLNGLINRATCMLFMKGNPEQPRCGFSRQIVQILGDMNGKYETFDILTDNNVREGLKKLSNWPTYPQLYVNGELVGGLDIIKEMNESGDLSEMIPKKE